MPVAKTYEKEFGDSLKGLPGGDALAASRKKSMKDFLSLGGMPHAKAEDWRYAPISRLRQTHLPRAGKSKAKAPGIKAITGWPLAIVRNGRLTSAPTIKGVEFASAGDALPKWADGFDVGCIEANPLERLNLALSDGGILVHVEKGIQAQGLEIVLINDGLDDSARYLRNLIALREGASLPVFIRTISTGKSGWLNMVTNTQASENASLSLTTDFEAAPEILVSTIFNGEQKANSQFDYGTVAAGLASLRHEIEVRLDGKGASANLSGGMLAARDETLDFVTRIHHQSGGATSTQTFKGVAAAEGKTAFQGRIVVEEQAQQTDARQNCNNLILDRSGEANVKPELLIFADDVACAHGATVGEIDETQLFYLMQRGLPAIVAKGLLVKAFLGEVVETFTEDALHGHFAGKINAWMEKNGTVITDE